MFEIAKPITWVHEVPAPIPTSGVVFTYRERLEDVLATLAVIATAGRNELSGIDVLVNGNFELAASLRKHFAAAGDTLLPVPVRIWSVERKGKDHSWNEYIHSLWNGQTHTFFFDGYTCPEVDAIAVATALLQREPHRLAIAAMPLGLRSSSGLGAESKAEGGLCGGMFLLSQRAMREMKKSGFRLPVGLYGFDTVLGAVLGYGLEPEKKVWDVKSHIGCDDRVAFHIHSPTRTNAKTARHFVARQVKAGLRKLVAASTKHYFAELHLPISVVPSTVESYVAEWIRMKPFAFLRLAASNPLSVIALRHAFVKARRRRKVETFIQFY